MKNKKLKNVMNKRLFSFFFFVSLSGPLATVSSVKHLHTLLVNSFGETVKLPVILVVVFVVVVVFFAERKKHALALLMKLAKY